MTPTMMYKCRFLVGEPYLLLSETAVIYYANVYKNFKRVKLRVVLEG